MGLRGSTGGQKAVIFSNALIRFAALIIGAATIGTYAQEKGYWKNHDLPGRIGFELAVGALAMITAAVLGAIPFFLSYQPVALAAPWDFIMFLLYSAAFGLMKAVFYHSYNDHSKKFEHTGSTDENKFRGHWNDMRSYVWINLAGMIIFLISAIMGAVLFFLGKKSSRVKGTYT